MDDYSYAISEIGTYPTNINSELVSGLKTKIGLIWAESFDLKDSMIPQPRNKKICLRFIRLWIY